MSILYIECFSGISGDMLAGAMIDLGIDRQKLITALNSLAIAGVDGFSIEISEVFKSGVRACDFLVKLDENHENHDHDMGYLYGHLMQKNTSENKIHGAHMHRDHMEHWRQESHEEHVVTPDLHHTQEERSLNQIVSIIESSALDSEAKTTAERIFDILATAEAAVHGKSKDEIHFHEVGAVDSIVDIAAIALCLSQLKEMYDITDIVISPLYEGSGTVRCRHGILPIPVPAVSAIVQTRGIPIHLTGVEGELITPTGAAAAAALRTKDFLPNEYQIKKVGVGAGKRAYQTAGTLRAMILDRLEKS